MMSKKKISIPRKITSEIQKYPMVEVEWYDIVSDSSWTSFAENQKDIDSIGNTTIIPNSVITNIRKLTEK